MPNYKDPNGRLHWLDSDAFAYLLPAGTLEISQAEADAINAADQPAAQIPASVTPLQARRALLAAGKLAAVEAAVSAADQATQLAWQYAASFERASPFVASLATAVGLTDAQIDDLFRSAATFV